MTGSRPGVDLTAKDLRIFLNRWKCPTYLILVAVIQTHKSVKLTTCAFKTVLAPL